MSAIDINMVNDAVNSILECFQYCRDAEIDHDGGLMRSGKQGKGPSWEKFMEQCIQAAIKTHNLPFTTKRNHTFNILEDITISMDIVVFDQKNIPIYCIESKDYTDMTMYRRFLTDCLVIKKMHPTMKFLSLSGQVGSKKDTQMQLNKLLDLDRYIFIDTLTQNKRNSKSPLWLTQYSTNNIIQSTNEIIIRLSAFIK